MLAADSWGSPEQAYQLPEARLASHEDLLHRALGTPSILVFDADRSGPWLSEILGHRAVGVVYSPGRERHNYVATRMGARYDALFWFEETSALRPLGHERIPAEAEFETEPSGF